ncbi:MAG: 3-phosphoshikimate 1-carboxyvinyltransferase [Clostridiales bacterium]|nr:3-phosphoshikimate 1-carboxyvinyltransferase [Clostridiales bacterium]
MSDIIVRKLNSYEKTIDCPSDKSISVRAVILSSYAVGRSVIRGLSLCDDVKTAIECMKMLGAEIELDGNTAFITGAPFHSGKLYCGNSATVARLLIGLLSGMNGIFELDGDAFLRNRPMKRVVEPLKSMGAVITDTDGRLPIKIIGSALRGMEYELPIPSAQVKSALLLAGLNASGSVTVMEKIKTRDHTEIMLKSMNGKVDMSGNEVSVTPSILYARDTEICGDVSSAAYPICLALGMRGGRVVVKNVGINKTRTKYLDFLLECGADITFTKASEGDEPYCDVIVRGGNKLKPITVTAEDAPMVIDEIPVLCALSCFIDGESVFDGLSELRVKESDRVQGIIDALCALGADITEKNDRITVRGGKALKFGTVNPNGDHRIAMSAAVAGALGNGVCILGGECVDISYPGFFEEVVCV